MKLIKLSGECPLGTRGLVVGSVTVPRGDYAIISHQHNDKCVVVAEVAKEHLDV